MLFRKKKSVMPMLLRGSLVGPSRGVSVTAPLAAPSGGGPLFFAAHTTGPTDGPSAWGGLWFGGHFNGRIDSPRLIQGPLDRAGIPIDGLRPGWDIGLAEPSCADIDVARLHAAYLKRARTRGAALATDARVVGVRRDKMWRIETRAGTIEAATLVNAAGAWADEVAAMAGVRPIGIQPYRRTMVQLRVDPPAPADLPLIVDALGRFYFKPEGGGRLWVSPNDETPCAAGDCAAEEIDVAIAIDRLQQVVDWRVERVERAWAGLRSFAPDRLPVYGPDPGDAGFFWYAGQGGFGIQTAPAAAKLAAALLLGEAGDPMIAAVDPALYLATRFDA